MDIVSRAQNIVRTPQSEWRVIADEPTAITALYTGYVVILAAVPLVAELLHLLFSGASVGAALVIPFTGYAMSMINVAVIAVIASKLAPRFGGVDDLAQGFKLAAYAATAAWLGGVFLLLPRVGWLLRLACSLYSVCVFYLGITELTRVPPERRILYFICVLLAAGVISVIIVNIVAALTGQARLMHYR
jgi:hypothetical protein